MAWNVPRPFSPIADAMRVISSMVADRLGTGLPASPECVGDFDVAKPMAPASIASPTMARMRSISSDVASRSVASSPIT